MSIADPSFPPLLTGHGINTPNNPLEHACQRAGDASLGAGDIVWARRTDCVDLAIILEPDIPLTTALQMAPLLFVAIADSLGALMPPRTGVYLRWPDAILVNGGICGKVRIAAATTDPCAVPDWLVVAATLRLHDTDRTMETGYHPDETTLADEGGAKLQRTQLLQSIAAHFLTWLNIWQDDGFPPVHARLIGLIEGHENDAEFAVGHETATGRVMGLDDEMQLLIKINGGGTHVAPLMNHLVAPEA